MITKYKENIYFRHIFCFTIVYFAAHWFLLVATGRWWDDWVYADKNWDYMLEVFTQSSIPFHAVINAGLWIFPDGFNRILTFIYFYIGAILFYCILRKVNLFSKEACFWITLLYIVIPINDARITWICYGYSLGLFLFWVAFYLGTLWKEYTGKKRIIIRTLSVFLLMVSFDTESIMLLTLIILFYFYYFELREDWKWKEIRDNIKKLVMAVIHHIDYLVAPIVWYVGSKILFPGYGIYGGHSYIYWDDLKEIIINSPRNAYATFKNIWNSYVNLLGNTKVAMIVVLILLIYIACASFRKLKVKSQSGELAESFLKVCGMTLLGIIVFYIGFFPYVVKRNAPIENIYTNGRDTLLLGIGTAVILYYGLRIFLRSKVRQAANIILISVGVFHFNFIYLDWQEAYYQQLQLQHAIAESDEIKNNDTFLIMYKGALLSPTYYQTNGNSWAATGEQTRYYMTTTDMLYGLIEMNEDTWSLNAYGMNEYDYGDKTIDGIIFVDYTDIGKRTLIRQKINELFDKDEFNEWIDDLTNVKYVSLTKEDSDNLLQLYVEGKLNDSVIYEMYY